MNRLSFAAARGLFALAAVAVASSAGAQTVEGAFAAAVDAGAPPQLKMYDAGAGLQREFLAYAPGYTGGVRVAMGDLTGDGVPDLLVAPGANGGTEVRVFDGTTGTLARNFFAFGPLFAGGVHVAAGDLNGDGRADIITGAGSGANHVRVFDGRTLAELRSFEPFAAGYLGGVTVASGDVNGDGFDDIIVGAGVGALPSVRVFDAVTGRPLHDFLAYDAAFTGGVFVAGGDVDGDGRADIITGADAGATPHVKVFSGANLANLQSFFAYEVGFTGGVRVATADLDGDGRAEVMTTPGSGRAPQLNLYLPAGTSSFLAFTPSFTGGVYVAGAVEPVRLLRDGFEDF